MAGRKVPNKHELRVELFYGLFKASGSGLPAVLLATILALAFIGFQIFQMLS